MALWCTAAAVAALPAKPISPYGVPTATASAPAMASAASSTDDLPLGPPQFNSTFIPLPPNTASLGYHPTATSEFGDLVRLSGAAHYVEAITITMASWAIRSDYPGSPAFGYTHPLTLKVYAVDRSASLPKPGAVLAEISRSFLIPWRPEPTAGAAQRAWRAADGNLYTGLAFNATFDLGALVRSLPDEVIFSVAFNTQHHGPKPLGVPGPYNALHVALSDKLPSPGADVEPDAVFWQTALASNYADGGVDGVNRFRRDRGWAGVKPAARFTNSPYGSLLEVSIELGKLGSPDPRTEAAFADAEAFVTQALLREFWDGNGRLTANLGRLAYNLIAAATDSLQAVAASNDPHARESRQVIDQLLDVSETLAEIALGDAIIGAGNARRISRSQGAIEEAHENEAGGFFSDAVEDFGAAWREAQMSLR